MRTRARRLAVALLLCAIVATPVLAGPTHELVFRPVPAVGPSVAADPRIPWPSDLPTVRPVLTRAAVRPVVPVPTSPLIVVARSPQPTSHPTGDSLRGLASFYCTPVQPICHHSYPVGSMVAAACGKLRRAIGSDWRGRVVTVRYGSRSVQVRLMDWCASETKTVDLYGAPFARLAPLSRGVIPVVVAW